MKEQDKTPEKQLNEVDIGNIPEKEFKIIIAQMISVQSCPTLCDPMDCRILATPWTSRILSPWNFPGKSTGVGCHFLLQGIFPNEGLNPGVLHCRQAL